MSEMFFADGDWQITASEKPEAGNMNTWSCIGHKCKVEWWKKMFVKELKITPPRYTHKEQVPLCSNCADIVPSSLVGLWKMHNWDKIQEWEAYQAEQETAMLNARVGHTFYMQPWKTAAIDNGAI